MVSYGNIFSQNENKQEQYKVFIRLTNLENETINKIKRFGTIQRQKESKIQVRSNFRNRQDERVPMPWLVLETDVDIEILLNQDEVIYAQKFIIENETKVGFTGLIYAKLKPNSSKIDYDNLEQRYNIQIVDLISYQNQVLKILVNKNSHGSVFEVAKNLEESARFEYIEIGKLSTTLPACAIDLSFNNQWNLKNTGQINNGTLGVDINFCEAHAITSGEDIIVAVIDNGVEVDDRDLEDNIIEGFDATGNTTNGDAATSGVAFNHGTNCAGIIGAVENTVDITGVAPKSSIMPCRFDYLDPQTSEWIAECIDFAWQNGADVLSNSYSNKQGNQLVLDAIERAATEGRNELGCVMVFASGNRDENELGAYALSEFTLSVGAIDMCGNRLDGPDGISCATMSNGGGSNFGTGLDVVAPGINIITTRVGSGLENFSGTSSATPHVAGLAALILSINPCLTEQEVRDIIKSTAQKLSGYNLINMSNGLWNEEIGYGLIDAGRATSFVLDLFLQNKIETVNIDYAKLGSITAGKDVNPNSINTGDYIIPSGRTVEFKANRNISLQNGFKAANGATFSSIIEHFNENCNAWDQFLIKPNGETILEDNSRQKRTEINIDLDSKLNVYPNPCYEVLNLDFISNSEDSKYLLDLYNIQGSLIIQRIGNVNKGENQIRINLADFPEGVYLIQLKVDDNTITKKVMHYEY